MKEKSVKYSIKNIKSLFNIIGKISRKRIVCGIVEDLVQSLQNIFWTVVFLRFIIDGVKRNKPIRYFYYYFAIFAAIFFICRIFIAWYNASVKPIANIKISETIERKIYEKIYNIDVSCYDNSEFFNKYVFIIKNIQEKMLEVIDNFSGIIGSIFMCGTVLAVMTQMNKKSLIIIIVPLISTFFLQNKLNQKYYSYSKKLNISTKKINYINRCFYLKDYALEMRTTKISDLLFKKRDEISSEIDREVKNSGTKIAILRFINDLLRNRIPFTAVLVYAVFCATISKEIDISEMSVMLLGLVNLSDNINELTDNIMKLIDSSRYIDEYTEFLKIEAKISYDQIGKEVSRFKNEIKINSLDFRYEDGKKLVLEDINMKIKKGQRVAILGLNGSGKTTLMKLLLRMYDPESGSIEMDGVNIKEFNPKEYQEQFSIMMQDYKLMSLSIGENILCREVDDVDKDKIDRSLEFASVLEKLKINDDYINKNITNEFQDDGFNLSGGEMQKIAIGRAYAKDSDIFIFDEPTSAIDPIAEQELLDKIVNLPKDKTVIYILHRLSFAKYADKIFVIKNGKLIEEGNHEELMKMKGEYGNMFNKQSESYKTGVLVYE